MKSKLLAISAIGASFTALALTLGVYFNVAEFIALVLASVFVILPIYYNSYKACLLTYFAGGFLGIILGAFNIFNIVVPSYFLFFGLYPILRLLMLEKGVNKIIQIVIGVVWSIAYFYGLYFFGTLVLNLTMEDMPILVVKYIYFLIPIFSVLFYFIFDRYIVKVKILIDKYLDKIIK